ncbi:hypothetical protein BC938DRAFT_470821, partial [Jimgerdemannia flammicorona]
MQEMVSVVGHDVACTRRCAQGNVVAVALGGREVPCHVEQGLGGRRRGEEVGGEGDLEVVEFGTEHFWGKHGPALRHQQPSPVSVILNDHSKGVAVPIKEVFVIVVGLDKGDVRLGEHGPEQGVRKGAEGVDEGDVATTAHIQGYAVGVRHDGVEVRRRKKFQESDGVILPSTCLFVLSFSLCSNMASALANRNPRPEDHLLLVFIHGFRGSDNTFKEFPSHLRTVLTNSLAMDVDTVVYPHYKTKGYATAPHLHLILTQGISSKRGLDLASEIANREEVIRRHGGTGRVLVILCGHSMGGIVAADVIRSYLPTGDPAAPSSSPVPRIIGLLAYDTPFYGLNEHMVNHSALARFDLFSKFVPMAAAAEPVAKRATDSNDESAPTKSSGKGWGSWGLVAGIAGIAAAGAVAYMHKDTISAGMTNVLDHLEFVSVLVKDGDLRKRRRRRGSSFHDVGRRRAEVVEVVDSIVGIPDMIFRNFYTQLESDPLRLFINPPPPSTEDYFVATVSNRKDEIDAHTHMFDPRNSGYYNLAKESIVLCTQVVR